MREIRQSGSEGGAASSRSYPYRFLATYDNFVDKVLTVQRLNLFIISGFHYPVSPGRSNSREPASARLSC